MNQLDPNAKKWLSQILGSPFSAVKHVHSHQDEVYRIVTPRAAYYLKTSPTLKAEHDNLRKLETLLNVPKVINFYESPDNDYLLITELPGKNLVELKEQWPAIKVIETFAKAIRHLHGLDAARVFPEASAHDVLLHGDMALPNILVSEQHHIGYIDFGQLTYGAPELDIVDALWSLQRNLGPAFGEIFLEKYGSLEVTPKIKKALDFRYTPTED